MAGPLALLLTALVIAAGVLLVVLASVAGLRSAQSPSTAAGTATADGTAPVPARPDDVAVLGAAARTQTVVRVVGLVAGAVAALALSRWDQLGRGLLVAAPVAALVVAVVVATGQLLLRPPASTVRTASLVPRRVRDYAPSRLSAAVAAATGYLLAFLAVASAVASPDDLGRPGRTLALTDPAQGCSTASGPWPGSFYALPIALVVAVGLVVTALSLRRVALRPSLTGVDGAAVDDVLRRRSSRVLVAAGGVLVTVPALGVGLAASEVMRSLGRGSCGVPGWWTWAQGTLLTVQSPLLALLVWCGAVLLRPQVGEPGRPARPGAGTVGGAAAPGPGR